MDILEIIKKEMIEYEKGNVDRIHHFLKVHSFSRLISIGEQVDAQTQFIIEIACLVHDIGIKPALEKYGSDKGCFQEQEGIGPARLLLSKIGVESKIIERVSYLVGCHHTYHLNEGKDYQILIESDFLVNVYENHLQEEQIIKFRESVFRTKTGIKLLNTIYGLKE